MRVSLLAHGNGSGLRLFAENVGNDLGDLRWAELGFPGDHALGEIGGALGDEFHDLERGAAVFPFRVVERQSGELDAADGIAAQARRLLSKPSAVEYFRHFHEQWLGLDELENITRDAIQRSPLLRKRK